MSKLDWFLFSMPFVLLAIANICNEVRVYRIGGDAWEWAGKVSRLARKVGL